MLFAYAGVKFEDIRIQMQDWPSLKASTPMGQLPVLDVDGCKLCQSTAIGRYLAKEFGIAGKTNLDQALADMLMEGVGDMWGALNPTYMAKFNNPAGEKELWNKFKQDHLKTFLDRYSNFLKQNKTGWFVGKEITWADIGIAEFLNCLQECFDPEALAGHSDMKQFMEKVFALPKIKEYVAKRPKTAF